MSTIPVPGSLTTVVRDDIITGRAVRAISLTDIARATNATLAAGGVLVPSHIPAVTMASATAHRFYFRFRPRVQGMERRWSFRIRRNSGDTSTVDIAINGGTAETHTVSVQRATVGSIEVIESLATQSNSVATAYVDITPASADQIIEGIYCYESPRPSLEDSTTDRGTDTGLLAPELPIVEPSLANMSSVLADFGAIGSRPSLLAWSVPGLVGGIKSTAHAMAITGATYVAVPGAMPVLGRYEGWHTKVITVAFYAWTSSGTGGRVRATSSSNGTSAVVNVTSTTPAWYLATVTIDTEALTQATGMPSAAIDYLTPEAANATGQTTYIAAVAAYA